MDACNDWTNISTCNVWSMLQACLHVHLTAHIDFSKCWALPNAHLLFKQNKNSKKIILTAFIITWMSRHTLGNGKEMLLLRTNNHINYYQREWLFSPELDWNELLNLRLVTAATSSTTACFCSDNADRSLLFSSCNLPIAATCSFDSFCHVSSIWINSWNDLSILWIYMLCVFLFFGKTWFTMYVTRPEKQMKQLNKLT